MRERPTVRNLLTSSRFLALNGGLSEARSASSDVVLPFEGHLRKAMSESGRLKLLLELAESTVTIIMYCKQFVPIFSQLLYLNAYSRILLKY